MFKLTTLNLNGIRSATSKGLEAWVANHAPDCMAVQELKAQAPDIAGRFEQLAGMQGHFQCAQKKGYSGVGLYTRHEPSDVIHGFDGDGEIVGEFDAEGRCIELRFDTPARRLSILSVYFPSGSSGPERQAAKYRFLDVFWPHLMRLKAERDFIVCSDVNIAHQEKDLKNWKSNQKNSGFLPEERAWMTRLLGVPVTAPDAAATAHTGEVGGLCDVYRHLHPDTTDECYTWWSNRGQAYAKNVGWRLDYHLATPAIAALARSVAIYKDEKFSDHAPVTVEYDLTL